MLVKQLHIEVIHVISEEKVSQVEKTIKKFDIFTDYASEQLEQGKWMLRSLTDEGGRNLYG